MAGLRKPGEFCWINILTPQPVAAREFFNKLFGWNYSEIPGVGHRVMLQGSEIGGLFPNNGPNMPPDLPPCIGVMVKVESADATARKVESLGGKAKPPMDILDRGRMVECYDPNGANIDMWEPRKGPGTDVDPTLHGAPSWFETITTDVERAKAFYTSLFGWTAETKSFPGFDYTTFSFNGSPLAGMMPIMPHMGKIPAHWGVYFTVTNVDETVKLAEQLGATICIPPTDIPTIGRFAGLTSPQGVMFYAITYVPM